jgi:hypothetical protein
LIRLRNARPGEKRIGRQTNPEATLTIGLHAVESVRRERGIRRGQ